MRKTQPSFTSLNSQTEDNTRLERRRNRFINESTSTTNKSVKSNIDANQPLIGTCEKLEKSYLRLTSAPDQSTIRPLNILEKAFPFIMDKYKSNSDWSYLNSQLKSIRQDLMVQSIRNNFTVLVYEENARIALEMNDRDQFVQCQTQLEILYDNGCNRTHLVEFLIYRLLYSLLINDYKRVNRILIDIDQLFVAKITWNYLYSINLYRKLARYLVDLFIDIYRKQMIENLICGFSPTFPIEIVTSMLAYESDDICQEHLRSFGVQFLPNSMNIDCKTKPLRLVLHSNDSLGIIYCNSRVQINEQPSRLTASLDEPVKTYPKFEMHTEEHNATTIKILIKPNGFIGGSRIHCHWANNESYGQTAELIIGEKPGVIQLKERCQAHDYRYVECRFHAPIIARAFENRFPQRFEFSELNPKRQFYHTPPKLEQEFVDQDLIFRFDPVDRSLIPERTWMKMNITLQYFDWTTYQFPIEPIFTTNVKFQAEKISSTELTIRIHHNRTGTISDRLCSGHIQSLNDQESLRDIPETSKDTIEIYRLQSSTMYRICLRCYYRQTDYSFDKTHCVKITTKFEFPIKWTVAGAVAAVLLVILTILTLSPPVKPSPSLSKIISPVYDPIDNNIYVSLLPLIEPPSIPEEENDKVDRDLYRPMGEDFMQVFGEKDLSPDTKDLTNRQANSSAQ
ncbi:hypothetical protein I4U23_029025 [Adineta vaga]|nr:hypothetical protein I4U23_029025 [Adineta vaga]